MKSKIYVFFAIFAIFLTIFANFLFYEHFYPVKYKEEILSASQEFSVKKELIASVINVESNFNANALSNAGAVGLMQIMPSTAKWLCGKLNEDYDEEKLIEPKYNIRLGTYYLKYLSERFSDLKTALASYNAGPTLVSNWLLEYSEDGVTLDEIPYSETMQYVKKVERNLKVYSWKF